MNMQINVKESMDCSKEEGNIVSIASRKKKKAVSNRSICQVYNDSSVACIISSHTLVYGSLAVSNAVINYPQLICRASSLATSIESLSIILWDTPRVQRMC